jgi:tRNA pseudouridine55 synthase
VSAVVASFKGRQEQMPPMYSAVKVKGRKLYELAREGKTANRTPRQITVYRSQLLSMTPDGVCEAEFEVSKGTYIRTLVDDIGIKLGCGATLTALCRMKSGQLDLSVAFTLDELTRLAEEGGLESAVIDLNELLRDLPSANLNAGQVRRVKNGVRIPAVEITGPDGLPVILDSCCSFNAGEPVRLLDESGELFGLGSFSILEQGVALCLQKSLWEAGL